MYCRNCGKEVTKESEYCTNCGAKPMAGNSFCFNCGSQTNELAEICVKCGVRLNNPAQTAANAPILSVGVSPKSRTVAAVLAFFLGQFGGHRFYTGKIGTAVTMLIITIIGYATVIVFVGIPFLAAVGIWNLIDFIVILVGKFKDKNGLLISDW
jgi:TM2 domain-containing membrane protein YozV